MKDFKFKLDKVLDHKQRVLDDLMVEHGRIIAQVRLQTEILEAAKQRYREYNEEYTLKKQEGMTVAEALKFQNGLHVLEMNIDKETERLEKLIKREEAKRAEVVEAKKETSSLERLREIKKDSYDKAVLKEEEAQIDELVASRRVAGSA